MKPGERQPVPDFPSVANEFSPAAHGAARVLRDVQAFLLAIDAGVSALSPESLKILREQHERACKRADEILGHVERLALRLGEEPGPELAERIARLRAVLPQMWTGRLELFALDLTGAAVEVSARARGRMQ